MNHRRCPQGILIGAAKRLPTAAVQEKLGNLENLSTAPALLAALLHSTSLTAGQREQLQELLRETAEPVEAFAQAAAEAEPDPAKRTTLLQRLAQMRVVQRVQLALKGNRGERLALIRDPCKVVQRAVLQLIAMNRKFRRNYTVVKNLINNSKTPLDVSLHLLPGITASDLKTLMVNKNISDTLRAAAVRLSRQLNEARSRM